jgi:hypothetical protein
MRNFGEWNNIPFILQIKQKNKNNVKNEGQVLSSNLTNDLSQLLSLLLSFILPMLGLACCWSSLSALIISGWGLEKKISAWRSGRNNWNWEWLATAWRRPATAGWKKTRVGTTVVISVVQSSRRGSTSAVHLLLLLLLAVVQWQQQSTRQSAHIGMAVEEEVPFVFGFSSLPKKNSFNQTICG